MIILEMFHERISLNSALLLLLVNFVSEFRLELMYISLSTNIMLGQASLISMVFSSLNCCHSSWKSLFCLYYQNKSSESKGQFRQASNHCKRVLQAAKLAYATKTKESIISQKLCSPDFRQIANSVLNKGKSVIPLLFNSPEVLPSASDKLFAKNFSKNSNLNNSGISLPTFSSRSNLKLYNISVTPKMVKKVIMNLDSSKGSGPYCIPVVVLKNCEPEL